MAWNCLTDDVNSALKINIKIAVGRKMSDKQK